MATIALTTDLTARTHSPWWVSLLFIVTFLPSVIVGLAFGPLVDRLSRKRLIVNADLIRLAVFVALVFVHTPEAIIVLAAVAYPLALAFVTSRRRIHDMIHPHPPASRKR